MAQLGERVADVIVYCPLANFSSAYMCNRYFERKCCQSCREHLVPVGQQHKQVAINNALEVDPHYELARVNRQMVLDLKEGETLPADIPFIDYYGETWKHRHRT